jgi:hypothetical protein
MPPLPRPKATGSGSGTQSPRTRTGRGGTRESSSTPPPAAPPRRGGRQTKAETLEVKVARMYNMFGTMLMPMGRFYPALGPLGQNLRTMSDDAAEAWIDLAEQDKRVKEALESMTSASVWGNVIGVHFAIFSAALPGGEIVAAAYDVGDGEIDIAALFGQMSPAEQAAAQALAAQMVGTPAETPARDRSTGGPGDTIVAAPAPQYDPAAPATDTAAPPVQQSTVSATPAGIVSAAQLGVQSPGDQGGHPFPTDSTPPSGR